MTTTKLKRSLGTDGQSLTDESFGVDGLKAVLQALARGEGRTLEAFQATPAVATLTALVVDVAGDYDYDLRFTMGTTGVAADTDVDLLVNGVSIQQLVIDNAEADDITKNAQGTVTLAVDDLVTLAVTAIPTSGADISASARLKALTVE